MAPPGTQSATVAETVANLLHSLFSRSSADLLGMSGYIFQNSCVCAGKALHTVDLPRERCHKDRFHWPLTEPAVYVGDTQQIVSELMNWNAK